MLQKFSDTIWTAEQPQAFFGLEMGARMTVIDLGGTGELLVHSPIRPTPEIVDGIRRLGKVTAIIAPCLLHHLYAGEFQKEFPEAKLYGVPGLEKKRPDLNFNSLIRNDETYPWSAAIGHQSVLGVPYCNEVVFYLREEKVLLVTDVGIHICEDSPLSTRLIFKAMGMFKTFGWSKPEKWMFIRNRSEFKASVEKILEWNFDKIILSHGKPVVADGHQQFQKAFL